MSKIKMLKITMSDEISTNKNIPLFIIKISIQDTGSQIYEYFRLVCYSCADMWVRQEEELIEAIKSIVRITDLNYTSITRSMPSLALLQRFKSAIILFEKIILYSCVT